MRNGGQVQTKEVKVDVDQTLAGKRGYRVPVFMYNLGELDLTVDRGLFKGIAHSLCNLIDRLVSQTHHVGERLTYRVIQRHHDRQGDKGEETARHRVDILAFVQLLNFFLRLRLILGVALLDNLCLALYLGHLLHVLLLMIHERKKNQLDNNGKGDNRKTVVLNQAVQPHQNQTERSNNYNSEKFSHWLLQIGDFFLRHRIIGIVVRKRMTAEQTKKSQPAAFDCAIFFNGLRRILGTGRNIPAGCRGKRRDMNTIKPNRGEQNPFHDPEFCGLFVLGIRPVFSAQRTNARSIS